MRAVDVIRKKREGRKLTHEELGFILKGYVAGDIPDYQISSLLMAIYFQGMDDEETGVLTRLMIDSGEILDFSGLGPLVDKHSTGGVGDKISLPLAPLAAACGLRVPMMSGRGLGHTGGTLDKLESISGFSTKQDSASVRKLLEKIGYAMFGQSDTMVPADRLLYSLRDVTSTVESIPLITASILSKKFAEGADALVFDVKCGQGAFMKTQAEAEKLAASLTGTARSLGKSAIALVTRMEEPLGLMVGNWLEVEESLDILEGKGPEDVLQLTLELNARMLVAGKLAATREAGLELGRRKLSDGSAMELFLQNIEAQGGVPEKVLSDRGKRRAYCCLAVKADRGGWVTSWDAMEIGLIAGSIGAGRARKEDRILPNTGIQILQPRGRKVEKGDELCLIWADDDALLLEAKGRVQRAVRVEEKEPEPVQVILSESQS